MLGPARLVCSNTAQTTTSAACILAQSVTVLVFRAWSVSTCGCSLTARCRAFLLPAGGLDGVLFSNSLYFERALGWRTMLFEACPGAPDAAAFKIPCLALHSRPLETQQPCPGPPARSHPLFPSLSFVTNRPVQSAGKQPPQLHSRACRCVRRFPHCALAQRGCSGRHLWCAAG